jgi:ABC-type transport system substrate-binding protein
MITEAHKIAGVNRDKAIELYHSINDIAINDANSIFVLEKDVVIPMRTWVKGYDYNPNYAQIVMFYDLRIEK